MKILETRIHSIIREIARSILREVEENEPIRQKFFIDVPQDVMMLSQAMKDAGHQLFIVGGAVRDSLLGKLPKDIDLTTDATPTTVIKIVQGMSGFKISGEVGKAFGVVLVVGPSGEAFEIATFRRDLSGGRRPDAVEFTSIDQDVARRDLTINALFYDIDASEIVDFVGGIDDIKNNVIRAVGDPAKRFGEDKLRILRAVRFAARFGSELDAATADAIRNDNFLDEVSPDRIHDEFLKGLKSAKSVVHFLTIIDDLDLFDQIFGGLSINREFTETKDVAVQLALLLRDIDPDKMELVLSKHRFTSNEIAAVKFLLHFQNLTSRESSFAVSLKKLFKNSKCSIAQLINFANAAKMPSKDVVDAFIKFLSMPSSITASDLMMSGIKGRAVGEALNAAEEELFLSLF